MDIVFAFLWLFIFIISIYFITKRIYTNVYEKISPSFEEYATVISKRKEKIILYRVISKTNYFLTYDTEEGETIELVSSKKIFKRVSIGDSGMIKFKFEKLRDFRIQDL